MRRSIAIVLFATMILAAPDAHSGRFFTETIQSSGFAGSYIAVAVDDNCVPHVVYWDFTNFVVVYATRVNGTWTTEVIEASVFTGSRMSIAVDSQNIPHMVYHRSELASQSVRYASRAGGVWTVEDVDVSGDDVGNFCAIAIDAQDRPHVAYQNITDGDLWYGVKDGAWSTELASAGIGRGGNLAFVLDTSGRPHICHTNLGTDVFYSRKIGSWTTETAVSTSSTRLGISFGVDGHIYLLRSNAIYSGVVRRDHVNGGWTDVFFNLSPALPDGGFVIDANNQLRWVFQDRNEDDMREASLTPPGPGWTETIVDGPGPLVSLGPYSDLALDPYGNSVVVYSDDTNGDAMYADAGVRLSTGLSGVTWPVGGERTVQWRGVGTVDLFLSTDGGASYAALATDLQGGNTSFGGQYTFTVPHQPSRFCKIKIERSFPFGADVSDSLFTIETNVSLLSLVVTPPASQSGNVVSWATDPGPEDLAGYRLERGRGDEWSTLVSLTKQTSHHDEDGNGGDRYRLYAVNGLGSEYLLGTSGGGDRTPSVTALDVFPNPFTSGDLTIQFATGGLGGAPGDATVSVYDVTGRLVRTLASGRYAAGVERVTWDGRDASGALVPSGVYFVRSLAGAEANSRKLLIVR